MLWRDFIGSTWCLLFSIQAEGSPGFSTFKLPGMDLEV